jgi:hypothetical protein
MCGNHHIQRWNRLFVGIFWLSWLFGSLLGNDIFEHDSNPALLESMEKCYCKANWVRVCMQELSTQKT